MNKTWYHNNLDTVGKWVKIIFLFGLITVTVLMFTVNISSYANALDTISADQPTELKIVLNVDPVSSLIQSPSQDIDFSRFFSSSTVSSGDITGFLKEATITGIKLSILIISIITQIIKGLLSVFK